MKFRFLILLLSVKAFGLAVMPQWVNPTRADVQFQKKPMERTKPIIMGDILYFANQSGDVHAVERLSNRPLWKTHLTGPVEGAFTYARSKLYVGDRNGVLWALNSRDGSVQWKFQVKAEWLSVVGSLRDVVFASTSDDQLFALNELTGKEIWHYEKKGDAKITMRGTAGPVVADDSVYQGFSNGSLVKLSAADGQVQWQESLRLKDNFHDVDASPIIDGDTVYVATVDNQFFALNKETGKPKWKFPVGTFGGFLVNDDRIYISGFDSTVVSLDKKFGELKWRTSIKDGVGTQPAKVGEHIVVTTSSDPTYVIRMSDGKIEGQHSLGAGTLSGAAAHSDGSFYCMSNYGNVFAFQIMATLVMKEGPKTLATPSAIYRYVNKREDTLTP